MQTALLPLETEAQWGKIVGYQYGSGERYYYIQDGDSVAFLPASVVEASLEEK